MTERGLSFHWFLPTYGDSRGLMAGGHGSFMSGDRPATLRYLNQLTAAAEDNGFEGVLTPTGAWCDFLDKTQRYARTGEFPHIVRELWSRTEPFSFTGEHLRVKDAILSTRPDPIPPVFFGGSSGPAGPIAARYSDTYLTWGEPVDAVAEKLDWIRGLPRWSDRTPRWPIACSNTPRSGSTSSSCPVIRTWRRRTGSARACCRFWNARVRGHIRRDRWRCPRSRRSPRPPVADASGRGPDRVAPRGELSVPIGSRCTVALSAIG